MATAKFTLTSTNNEILNVTSRDAYYFVQADLNGGTASMEIRLDDAAPYTGFDDNGLADGELKRVFIPSQSDFRIVTTGSPTVFVSQ